jgi:cytochrome c-type biogenesis protein CcmH/NrfF
MKPSVTSTKHSISRLWLGGAAVPSKDSVVPPGLASSRLLFPALKRWAKFGRPFGTLFSCASLRRWLQATALAVAVIGLMGAGDDSARFKDLGHRMMCTCGCGQVLLECNHVGCQSSDKMRNQLLAALDKGGSNSDDLILQGFVQEYGPTVIAAPTATGFNRVAWIMPFLVLALGIAFAVYIVRSWKNRPEPALADGIVIPQGNELDEFQQKARRETEL